MNPDLHKLNLLVVSLRTFSSCLNFACQNNYSCFLGKIVYLYCHNSGLFKQKRRDDFTKKNRIACEEHFFHLKTGSYIHIAFSIQIQYLKQLLDIFVLVVFSKMKNMIFSFQKFGLEFKPKLFNSLKDYSKEKFANDLMSGIIVGIVALPLAIAFGIASGVSPEQGIITAIIGGFIVSFLGGSSVQIGGPTGAFIIIVYGIIQQHGFEGLVIATILAGFMLIGMGLLRLGTIIKFIPYPIIVGFTRDRKSVV